MNLSSSYFWDLKPVPHQAPVDIGDLAIRFKWMRGRGRRWTIWGTSRKEREHRKAERLLAKNARREENGLPPIEHYKDV